MRLTIVLLVILLWPAAPRLSSQEVSQRPPEYEIVFERQRGPDVPTLQEIAAGSTSDAQILEQVVAYYDENKDRLATLWREDHPTRLAAIFAMYVTHISLPYGETPYPASVIEFTRMERAHCGTYLVPQTQLASALGLTYRTIEFVGEHAWMEVWIDDHWELFDATTNTWLSQSSLNLLAGEPREYQYFYTPMLDIARPDARLHLAEGYNMPRLRSWMPLMGTSYFPPGELIVGQVVGSEATQ